MPGIIPCILRTYFFEACAPAQWNLFEKLNAVLNFWARKSRPLAHKMRFPLDAFHFFYSGSIWYSFDSYVKILSSKCQRKIENINAGPRSHDTDHRQSTIDSHFYSILFVFLPSFQSPLSPHCVHVRTMKLHLDIYICAMTAVQSKYIYCHRRIANGTFSTSSELSASNE